MEKTEIFEIWRVNKPKIISSIRKRIKRETDIEDISQEVFIKFWTKNEDIIDKDRILHWLYRVTLFTIADYYRKKEYINLSSLTHNTELTVLEADESSTDESKKLLPIINSLPVKYKTVLLMSDIYGLSHKEIAKEFDLTLSCVKTRVIRARKLLAERMQECCLFSYVDILHYVNEVDSVAFRLWAILPRGFLQVSATDRQRGSLHRPSPPARRLFL
jgi:RNA polymerase sigma-70 factor (ECF subfamily)